ncbi:Hypothetical_protein [Hexamita inflata]|uniref:Hypothetical_protein n=1 Tax=Hexamita inflata TaxID=28002 RepID=A0ABP1GYI4_9EUKA
MNLMQRGRRRWLACVSCCRIAECWWRKSTNRLLAFAKLSASVGTSARRLNASVREPGCREKGESARSVSVLLGELLDAGDLRSRDQPSRCADVNAPWQEYCLPVVFTAPFSATLAKILFHRMSSRTQFDSNAALRQMSDTLYNGFFFLIIVAKVYSKPNRIIT